MKILLVRTSYRLHENYVYNRVSPPMGVMYLASHIRSKFSGAEVKIVDLLIRDNFERMLAEFKPDVVGFSTLTCEAFLLPELIKRAKASSAKPLVIVGGPHATSSPLSIFAQTLADAAVLGEGEITFAEIIEKYIKNEPLEGIKGAIVKSVDKNGNFKIVRGGARPSIERLDDLAFPAWDLIEIDEYQKYFDMNIWHSEDRYMTIFTSRGCPYQCIYCHRIFGKRPRFRSAENVVEEIELVHKKYKIKEFQVIDDIYNLYPARVIKIAQLLKEKNIKVLFSFPNGLRADILNEETLRAMKEAGAYNLTFAIESASPRLQKLMRKGVDLEKAEKVIEMAEKMGFIVNGFFMLGFPGETYFEMMGTVDFAVHSKLHHALFFSVNPHGFTELSETFYKSKADDACEGTQKYHYFNRYFNLANVSPIMFAYIMLYANIRFYVSLPRVYSLLKITPNYMKFFKQGIFFFFSIAYHNLVSLVKEVYNSVRPKKSPERIGGAKSSNRPAG